MPNGRAFSSLKRAISPPIPRRGVEITHEGRKRVSDANPDLYLGTGEGTSEYHADPFDFKDLKDKLIYIPSILTF